MESGDSKAGSGSGHTAALVAAGAVVGLVLLAARAGWLESTELAIFDRLVRSVSAESPALEAGSGPEALAAEGTGAGAGRRSAPSVVLVSLREDDFARHGHPIPDALLARALERLVELGASAVGVDLYRSAPAGDTPEALAGWAALAQSVARHPRIVMTELLPTNAAPGMAPPAFAAPAQIGFNNMPVDPGSSVRRAALYSWDDDGTAHVGLGLRLASLHLAARGVAIGPDLDDPAAIRVGSTPLPPLGSDYGGYAAVDAAAYQIPLDFRRDPERFDTLSLEALLADDPVAAPAGEGGDRKGDPDGEAGDGELDRSSLRARVAGRVVVIGTDAPSVKDDFHSPRDPAAILKGHRLHAQVADQLIRAGLDGDAPRASVSPFAEAAVVVGFGWAATGIARVVGGRGAARSRGGALTLAVPLLAGGALLPFALAALLFAQGIWLPSAAPALAWAGAGTAALGFRVRDEARARRELASLFARFSSTKVADALWRERDAIMAGGRPRPQRVVLTALVSDLVGFTSAAEKLEPEALLAWIGRCMDALTRVIEAHGGHVDDYAGDGIKANFGVPIPSESEQAIGRDARQAVACAVAMGRALEQCNREWAAEGLPQARLRIGIATGPAVVGAIGSRARMKYTTLGDTINTAARLESFVEPGDAGGDAWQTRILVGDGTRAWLGPEWQCEDLGAHALKGKAEPLRIHRIRGETREDGS